MKFASQVEVLDRLAPEFAYEVARLQDEFEKRERLTAALRDAVCVGDLAAAALGNGKSDKVTALHAALAAAIERFVVDNF